MINQNEKYRLLNFQISKLEEQLAHKSAPELKNSEVKCNLLDALLVKHNSMKKLTRIRRDEGNILRSKLGMQPDELII